MRVFLALVLAAIIAVGLLFATPVLMMIGQQQQWQAHAVEGSTDRVTTIPGSYIISLDEDTPENFVNESAQIINDTIAEQGGNVTNVYENLKALAVENVDNPNVLLNASNASKIKTIEPEKNRVLLTQYLSTGYNRIDADRGTGIGNSNGREDRPNIDVAVIDAGIFPTHPDLNVFKRVNFLPSNYVGKGYNLHGTHVAGICCSKDNLGGVVSPIPGARIWNLIVCGGIGNEIHSDTCPDSAILGAMDYVVDNSASIEIGTMSVGGGLMTSTYNSAISDMWNAGVTFFVGAGNEARDTEGLAFCAATDVICVSALTDLDGKCGGQASGSTTDDRRASYSNFGSEVDIMAPGTSILSTWPYFPPGTVDNDGDEVGPVGQILPYIGASEQGEYARISGTSMATPLAAGVGGLIKLENPSFTPNQVKSNMQTNAYSQTQACDGFGKGGLVSGANSQGSTEKILYAANY